MGSEKNEGFRPGLFTPFFYWLHKSWVGTFIRLWHRPKLSGWENLPDDGPFLLVSNHSGGIALAELSSFTVLYTQQFDNKRPLAGYAHHRLYDLPLIHSLMRGLGAIPSTYEAAEETLNQGVPILMFPGGDHESLRPIWRANEVDFNGRKGFLKIARRAQIPIVPMGIHGSHYTTPILIRSKALAWLTIIPRLAGIPRMGWSLAGILGAFAIWLLPLDPFLLGLLTVIWLGSPLQFIPLIPWTIQFRIGEPLSAQHLFHNKTIDEAYHEVTGAIQTLVNGSSTPT